MSATMSQENRGMWMGMVGVAIFSLTLPFTRMAVTELNPVLVALGRAVVAAMGSAALLWWVRAPRPTPRQWRALTITSLGVVVGFPVFSSIAMRYVPASHGAVVIGILPLATALFGALRFGERPSAGFWIAAFFGSAVVVGFALWQGGGEFHVADLALFAAVIAAAMGYAEGGRLSQSMGGQQVISWALVLSMPILLPITVWLCWNYGLDASPRAWIGFGYVSLFSMFIGFFFWYKGLALGGIARVGQVQLLQPFLTLIGAALILGEALDARNFLFAIAVVAVVAVGRRMSIRR
ncbi:DMT family transporter [Noviherbaspirillum sp. Root189]|uniref:DMT family transporter n=1 Tax=Noviherbaspirillum sp. Root189 TaxID=1736487 RepID=UPI00070E8D76|nr:DMT family transporter [Noviherbaspirillum sp. Root189]KRB89088.1 multidrug DMT transporter permease [Noviherbaspirillum sp. Root189]